MDPRTEHGAVDPAAQEAEVIPLDDAVDADVPYDDDDDDETVTIRAWGTRGSIPSPGSGTALYGGNTSCLEVEYGYGRRLIFDAGTGLRLLGNHLVAKGSPPEGFVFLTHFHWDHIQGFPFFGPLYQKGTTLHIVGPRQQDIDIQTLFQRQMGPVYFPVPFAALGATITFDHLNTGSWRGGDFLVSAMRMRHPSYTVGYRIEVSGRVICYIPDNEIGGGSYEVGEDWEEEFYRFIAGSDVLIHDAMYTEEEYESKHGWGHSTFRRAVEVAARAEVARLLLFHHSPERSDDDLGAQVDRARELVARESYGVEVDAAQEGEQLVLTAKP